MRELYRKKSFIAFFYTVKFLFMLTRTIFHNCLLKFAILNFFFLFQHVMLYYCVVFDYSDVSLNFPRIRNVLYFYPNIRVCNVICECSYDLKWKSRKQNRNTVNNNQQYLSPSVLILPILIIITTIINRQRLWIRLHRRNSHKSTSYTFKIKLIRYRK